MLGKLRSIAWWAQRPGLYPEAARTLRRKCAAPEPTVDLSAHWADMATDPNAAIRWCGGEGLQSMRDLYPREYAAAEAACQASPFRMGGGGDVDLLYGLTEAVQATVVLETGVAYGWSSLAFLLSLRQRGGRLLSSDRPYPGQAGERWVGCCVADDLRDRWTLCRRADREAIPRLLAQSPRVDLVHYDSDKSQAGRRWAYPRLWQAVRPGGLFVSDDIEAARPSVTSRKQSASSQW